MVKPLFSTTSGARLQLVHSSGTWNLNWLFLPGGPGLGSESLLPLVNILNLPGKFWLLDLPGDGSNTTSNNSKSFSHWSSALIEAVSEFDQVILVAHSTGGMYALSLPELEDLLLGLVLLDSAPDAKWQVLFGQVIKNFPISGLEALQENYENEPSNMALKALTMASAPYLFTKKGKTIGLESLVHLPYNYETCQWSEKYFDSTYKAKWVPKIIPTLILAGKEDLITPLNLFKDDKRFHRNNIILKSIREAGHFPWIENPIQVAKEFKAYANRFNK